MNVLYNLIQDNDQIKSWLNNVFVVIDPSLNPDGYSRYTNWFISNSGKFLHPEHSDVEHMEPWPGGRVNHYLFDLNRDWAWQTQVETQQRIAKYNQWMPHIHADLHEMGYDDHYYFAPAAEPYHDAISDWQKDFQFEIGKNHARYFDENGWLYFSREIFDLLYPSYGDSWPTFNGSIGMTYEQAGHGMSGRSIRMSNGKDLTLQDRIDHHTTTSLSTVEMASLNKDLILEEFQSYFKNSKEKPIGKYKYYVVKQGEQIHKFTELLLRNKIDFEFVNESKSLKAYSYSTSKEEMVQVEQGDILLNVFQPKSTLLQTLMEEAPILSDSLTYDITAWSLPFAFNLKCFAWLNKPLIETSDFTDTFFDSENIFGPYGLAFKWNSSGDSKIFLSNQTFIELMLTLWTDW